MRQTQSLFSKLWVVKVMEFKQLRAHIFVANSFVALVSRE